MGGAPGMTDPDFIVIGAGSAGCVLAAMLAEREAGSVLVIEAGGGDGSPLVKMPFGLTRLMGSARDWSFKSAPQKALGGRQIAIPRGKLVGGSGSINSMVWFRGRQDDFDGWGVEGWHWSDVAAHFEAVEARLTPGPQLAPHPLTQQLYRMTGANTDAPPTPERESAGAFMFNMENGRRRSAADAYLHPAIARRSVTLLTGKSVDRIGFKNGQAREVHFADGASIRATKGVILSAGAIGSPSILLRSGIGPKDDLEALGIDVVQDAPDVGQNLQDHPGVGLHFIGPGYGLAWDQALVWALAPFNYLYRRRGPFGSPTVEGGAFFDSTGQGGTPDVQSHFIPFMLGWTGSRLTYGRGYFADVCVCRPRSRGALRLTSTDPNAAPEIDLGLLNDPADLDTLEAGLDRLREMLTRAELPGVEAFPGPQVTGEALRNHIRARLGTAYHPAGTLAMGGPVTNRLAVKGVDGLWVADASVMPALTSANTNAPCMMIGHRAAHLISEDAA